MQSYVAGWFLADEVYGDPQQFAMGSDPYGMTVQVFRDVVSEVHNSQQSPQEWHQSDDPDPAKRCTVTGSSDPCNFPFYWAEQIITDEERENPTPPPPLIVRHPYRRFFWRRPALTPTGRYEWEVPLADPNHPEWFAHWINVFRDLEAAKLVFMPFYYPWGAPDSQWRYRKHHKGANLNLELPDNPVWMGWQTYMSGNDPYTGATNHSLQGAFPIADYPSTKLCFEPVVEASSQGERVVDPGPPEVKVPHMYPRHVDIHKTARVLMTLRQKWLYSYDDRFTGFWFMGWNQTGLPSTGDAAWHQWTEADSYRYAEAVQNEFGAGTEGLPDVWHETPGGALITSGIKAVVQDDLGKGGVVQAFRIDYHVAPRSVLGPTLTLPFILGQRERVAIEIWMMADGARVAEAPVHTITEGYSAAEGYSALTQSPYGKYVGQATEQGSEKLIGTAAYWDGKWDHGVDDGVNAPARNDDPPDGEYYGAFLVLDGSRLEQSGQFVAFKKAL